MEKDQEKYLRTLLNKIDASLWDSDMLILDIYNQPLTVSLWYTPISTEEEDKLMGSSQFLAYIIAASKHVDPILPI